MAGIVQGDKYQLVCFIEGHHQNQKGKGEKERYTHLSVEFQRIARRDKKDFLSDQCKKKKKKKEENNGMGKTRDLFNKIRDNS